MPSGGGPGVGIGSTSRALCKLLLCLPKSQAYPIRTVPLVPALQLELNDVKVVDQHNWHAHPHPLGDHHPNHCQELLGQDCARQDLILPELKSIYYTRYCNRYQYYCPNIDVFVRYLHSKNVDIDVLFRYWRKKTLITGTMIQNDPPCHLISKSISTSCVDIDVK